MRKEGENEEREREGRGIEKYNNEKRGRKRREREGRGIEKVATAPSISPSIHSYDA